MSSAVSSAVSRTCAWCERAIGMTAFIDDAGQHYCSFNHLIEYGKLTTTTPPSFNCASRKQGTAGGNDPADCDWPTCGCDEYASKVIAALHESGWLSPAEVHEYAKKARAQVIREHEAEKQ